MTISNLERFNAAIERIDAANAADPNVIVLKDGTFPKEVTHAKMLSEWVKRLRPDADEALLLAARAHHIRRWEVPRSSYPEGRQGYLRWRRDLHGFHAEKASEILKDVGYDDETIARVSRLIHKLGIGRDPDAQALEDGLCLVFLETQFSDLSARVDDEKMIDVLRKTWRKEPREGQQMALSLSLDATDRGLIERALS